MVRKSVQIQYTHKAVAKRRKIMKLRITILLTLITFGYHSDAQLTDKQTQKLYPIIEDGLWGFINKSGKVKIEPKFRSVGQFSEGLAPVRVNGTYGYINSTGDFVIKSKYDFAYSFDQGQAKVYVDGKPYYIDKDGNKTFEHNFMVIYGFGKNDYSIVRAKSGSYGVINKQGKLLVDTAYTKINPFSDGLAIVTRKNHRSNPDEDAAEPVYERGVVNSSGQFIIPFGKYKGIYDFKNGFAKVELNVERQNGRYDHMGIIDQQGKLRFVIPAKKWHFDYVNENFSEGLATVDIYLVDPDTLKVWGGNNRNTYKGVVNSDGEIVFSNKQWDEITPFKYNRAFVQDINEDWYLINREGEILNKEPYQSILYSKFDEAPELLFQHAVQFVETEEGWGTIDTTGKFTAVPNEIDFDKRDMQWRGQVIFTKEDISIESDKYSYQYGFWNMKTGVIISPQFHRINFSEFTEDLIYVMQDERIGYINHKGTYVWREQKKAQQIHGGLNIDYMNRGHYYASSPYKKELAGFGGWGGSENDSKQISTKSVKFENGKLNIIVNSEDKEKYMETYEGMKMYVSNTSQDTIYFDAQDSRLYLKIQAQDRNGKWKDIEYLPSSWCGNSYHTLFLPPNYNWEFVVPKYEGEFKTKLRAELLYKKNKDQKEDDVLYSNEFEGSINPGQFWRKNTYYPLGLMDPYND